MDNAFAAFAKKVREPKKGEGPLTADASMPVRLGGAQRDGSLGDLRAAWNQLKTLQDPRDWKAEEYGLLAVIASLVAGTAFFYFSYVATPAPKEMEVSKAQVALQRAMAECSTEACMQQVKSELEPAVVKERQLYNCMDKAFSNTERNMCKSKYGGALTPFGF